MCACFCLTKLLQMLLITSLYSFSDNVNISFKPGVVLIAGMQSIHSLAPFLLFSNNSQKRVGRIFNKFEKRKLGFQRLEDHERSHMLWTRVWRENTVHFESRNNLKKPQEMQAFPMKDWSQITQVTFKDCINS